MSCNAGWPRYPASRHRCLEPRSEGTSRLTMMDDKTASSCETSCRFAPVTTSDKGTPRPSTSRWRLLPFFPPIGRVTPDLLLCQRSLEQRPVNALPSPHDSLHLVVLRPSRRPDRVEHTRSLPFQEPLVDRARAAKALPWQRFPLAACSQHIHDGFEHQSRRLGLATTARFAHVRLVSPTLSNRHQRFHSRPEVIGHDPRRHSFLRRPFLRHHRTTPSPRHRRLGMALYYLRITSNISRSGSLAKNARKKRRAKLGKSNKCPGKNLRGAVESVVPSPPAAAA